MENLHKIVKSLEIIFIKKKCSFLTQSLNYIIERMHIENLINIYDYLLNTIIKRAEL